jgi:hypothetical protein
MFGRAKLRPDWQVKTYEVPISRIETDDKFWEEARTLKNAWNEIVAAYRAFDEQITTLETEFARLKNEKLDAEDVKASLKQARVERGEKTRAAWKAQSPKVLYNDLETLRLAMESALSLAYKNGGTLRFKKGIESINFSKRFKSGGAEFAELLTTLDSRDAKLSRKPLALRVGVKRESRRSRNKTPLHGHFLIGKSRVPVKFTGVWSYPLFPSPEAAFVKKVALVGKFSRLKHWRWKLVLTIEEPLTEIAPDASLPIAALDLGYRRFPGYIRFGFVADSLGNRFELRLPDGNMISAYLKRTIKFLEAKGTEKLYVRDLKDYFAWDSAQSTRLEETKAQLKTLYDSSKEQGIEMPERWLEAFDGLDKRRNRGLLKLKNVSIELLKPEETKTEDIAAARDWLRRTVEIVNKWQEADVFFETEKEHFRRKFSGRRELLYRQTVKWLASNYSQLVWKEDSNLREIASRAKKSSRRTDAALKESNKYRQWTSLSQFRLFIKEQSSKTPGWLRSAASDSSSWQQRQPHVCDECGASIASDSTELMLVCASGHERDRDEREAANLLKEAAIEMLPSGAPLIDVPPHLREYIVRWSSGVA